MLTFAIRPALFVDDGPEALAALAARMAAEKAAKGVARRRGVPVPDEDDEDE